VLSGAKIRVEMADKTRAIGNGGIGLVHQLAQATGLVQAIDRQVHVLKVHRPYHESDHVLNLAYNAMCDGVRLEDIELRRNDEVFLDALGAERIPDPTTAGDFCRRFDEPRIRRLMAAIDEARLNVWARQPKEFFDRATIDMDGTLVITTGECKQGMDISYKGTWGYHPLKDEDYAEFAYLPVECQQPYRMVVVRKEIAQLAGGVRALSAPVDNLLSNWAYMVMTALAWNLKAWWALWLPEQRRWRDKHRAQKQRVLRMEFRTFLNAFIKIPCQIIRSGRQLIYRILGYNPHLPLFFRLAAVLRC